MGQCEWIAEQHSKEIANTSAPMSNLCGCSAVRDSNCVVCHNAALSSSTVWTTPLATLAATSNEICCDACTTTETCAFYTYDANTLECELHAYDDVAGQTDGEVLVTASNKIVGYHGRFLSVHGWQCPTPFSTPIDNGEHLFFEYNLPQFPCIEERSVVSSRCRAADFQTSGQRYIEAPMETTRLVGGFQECAVHCELNERCTHFAHRGTDTAGISTCKLYSGFVWGVEDDPLSTTGRCGSDALDVLSAVAPHPYCSEKRAFACSNQCFVTPPEQCIPEPTERGKYITTETGPSGTTNSYMSESLCSTWDIVKCNRNHDCQCHCNHVLQSHKMQTKLYEMTCWGRTDLELDPDLDFVVDIAIGFYHACAIKPSLEVICWGDISSFDFDQLSVPPGLRATAISISAGSFHTCAFTVESEVVCWGADYSGQSTVPTFDGTPEKLAVGSSSSCVVLEGSPLAVVCWGDPNVVNVSEAWVQQYYSTASSTAFDIVQLRPAVHAIWAAMVVNSSGDAVLVPLNSGSQAPPLPTTDAVVEFDLDTHTACAIRASDKLVVCSGSNDHGQTDVPPSLGAARSVSIAGSVSCAIRDSDGQILCWGLNNTFFPELFSLPSTPETYNASRLVMNARMVCGLREVSRTESCGASKCHNYTVPQAFVQTTLSEVAFSNDALFTCTESLPLSNGTHCLPRQDETATVFLEPASCAVPPCHDYQPGDFTPMLATYCEADYAGYWSGGRIVVPNASALEVVVANETYHAECEAGVLRVHDVPDVCPDDKTGSIRRPTETTFHEVLCSEFTAADCLNPSVVANSICRCKCDPAVVATLTIYAQERDLHLEPQDTAFGATWRRVRAPEPQWPAASQDQIDEILPPISDTKDTAIPIWALIVIGLGVPLVVVVGYNTYVKWRRRYLRSDSDTFTTENATSVGPSVRRSIGRLTRRSPPASASKTGQSFELSNLASSRNSLQPLPAAYSDILE